MSATVNARALCLLKIPTTLFLPSTLIGKEATGRAHTRACSVCNPKYGLRIRELFKHTGGQGTNLIKNPTRRAGERASERARAPRGMKGSYFINDDPSLRRSRHLAA